MIFYPGGGGVGLIGMWKAFDEWTDSAGSEEAAKDDRGPGRRLCADRAGIRSGERQRSESWKRATTVASGLRVPKPLGDFLVLKAVRESGGTAIAVSDEEMLDAGLELAKLEGMFRTRRRRMRCGYRSPAEKRSGPVNGSSVITTPGRAEVPGGVLHSVSAPGGRQADNSAGLSRRAEPEGSVDMQASPGRALHDPSKRDLATPLLIFPVPVFGMDLPQTRYAAAA